MKLKESNTIEFTPNEGSVVIPIEIEDEDTEFESVNLTGIYDTDVVNSVEMNLGADWSYCNILITYFSNSLPDPIPDEYEPAREGEVIMNLEFRKNIYNDADDPDHLHPIDVITRSQRLTINYIQGVNAPSTDPVPEYNPENPGESSDPDEITAAQEELTDGGVLGDNKDELKKELIVTQSGLREEANQVSISMHEELNKLKDTESKLAEFNKELDEESSKKKPNDAKIDNLTEKIEDYTDKLHKLMESLGNIGWYPDYDYEGYISMVCESYIDDHYYGKPQDDEHGKPEIKGLKNSNKGMEIDDQMNKLESNLTYLQKFAPQMVSNIATAAMEPNTAIVTTPTGPGAVAGNPMQSTGTLKRIMGQVLALSPVLIELLGQCKSLNLPKSISKPIADLSKVISMLQKLLK